MDEMNTVGTLYIVATPIGNARDMTERGRQILETANIIAAEDTRRSVVLLNKLGIRGNQLSANHKFNEYGKAKWFIEQLQQGKSIAVITDAGTPCISDPGNELIRAAIDAGIRVVGVLLRRGHGAVHLGLRPFDLLFLRLLPAGGCRPPPCARHDAPRRHAHLLLLRKPQAHHGRGGVLYLGARRRAAVPVQRHDEAPRDDLPRHARRGARSTAWCAATAPPRTPSSCSSRTTTTPTAKTSSTPRILP